jgi:hypothetical protein
MYNLLANSLVEVRAGTNTEKKYSNTNTNTLPIKYSNTEYDCIAKNVFEYEYKLQKLYSNTVFEYNCIVLNTS